MADVDAAGFILRTLSTQLQKERGGTRDRPEVRFYASGLGDVLQVRDKRGPSGCQRKAYLAFFPQHAPPLGMTTEALLNMEVGNAFHERLEGLFERAGILVRAEYPLRSDHVSGRLDWLLRIPGLGLVVADGKSMSTFAFKYATEPKPEHIAQVNDYAGELGITWCSLIYYNKENGDVRVFVFPFDRALFERTKSEAAQLAVKVSLDRASGKLDNLPPMPDGINADKWPCSWGSGSCPFFRFCHGGNPPHLQADEPVQTISAKPRGA